MEFSAIQIGFLQRLVSERRQVRQAGAAALYFCEHFGLGTRVRSQVEYRDDHFQMAERLLRNNDLPVVQPGPNSTRAGSAVYGGMSEKSLSVAPHSQSVAVKALGRCLLNGRELYAPVGAYIVLTPEQAQGVACTRLMVVENLETFRTLEAYAWLDLQNQAVLAIYRGDPDLPNKDALEVIKVRTEPVWAFCDFDPAGLAIAFSASAGRLERLVLPSAEWLRKAANTSRGRQLFDSHVGQYAKILDACEHPQVKAAWELMKRLSSAVTQERMHGRHVPAALAA